MNYSFVCLNSESGIASVLEKDETLSKGNDPGCTVCEMAVVWAQNQLRQNRTKEQIDAYLNQVIFLVIVHFLCYDVIVVGSRDVTDIV